MLQQYTFRKTVNGCSACKNGFLWDKGPEGFSLL